ncbi:hypothetical protein ACP4OV_027542 [Aristida adscensionis]
MFAITAKIILCSHEAKAAAIVRPNLFIRLIGVEGLDPQASPRASPAFHLALDAEGGSPCHQTCNGGGGSMLRVSSHGMILAWGQVPHFCVNVATVEAKAEAAVLREEVRSLIWSEQQVVGKAEFDVEGDVVGIGYVRCKVSLSKGKGAEMSKNL